MKTKDAVAKRLESYLQEPDVVYGVIGELSTGKIAVEGKTSVIYVTLMSGVVLDNVLNVRVPNLLGTAVRIGYDSNSSYPGALQVLGVRDLFSLTGGGGTDVPGTGPVDHHKTHEWPSPDTVYIAGEQFLPSMYYPVAGALTVSIYPGTYRTSTGWMVVTQITVVSLAASVATITSGNAMFSIIVVDEDGDFVVRDGELVAEQPDPFISAYLMLTSDDIPEPEDGDTVICAVRLFYGQTELRCTGYVNDFIDARFSNAGGGGGAGGGTLPGVEIDCGSFALDTADIDAGSFV